MKRMSLALLLSACAMSMVFAADEPAFPEGNWKIGFFPGNFSKEQPAAIVKLSKKDGKLAGEVLAVSTDGFPPLKDRTVTFNGNVMTIRLSGPQLTLTFESTIPEKAAKVLYGNLGNERVRFPSTMTPTAKAEFGEDEPGAKSDAPAPYTEAGELVTRTEAARIAMLREKDADKKTELKTKFEAAKKTSDEKVPALYRRVLSEHGDTLAAYDAALTMLRNIETYKLTPEEATRAVGLVETTAAKFGPPIVAKVVPGIVESLLRSKNPKIGELALTYAQKAYSALKIADPADKQAKVLTTLRNAQQAAGKIDEANASTAKLVLLEKKIDEEYEKKVPPFAPGKYAGRKDGGNRIAVVELFTGAQCPPCVAADVGFDGLNKAFSPNDLVLIQYHMHIPGPDPLTNADSVRRWDYYNERTGNKLRGTPSILVNGKVGSGGGGGMADAKAAFESFKEMVEPILDEKTEIRVTGKATLQGDLISATAEIAGLKEGNDAKVRFLLVERTVRYVGGNGLRFHHQVMRGFVGSAEGYAAKGTVAATVKVSAVRDTLTKYLENYEANESPFPYPERALTLESLRAIALVQNDKTGEILGAFQIDLANAK